MSVTKLKADIRESKTKSMLRGLRLSGNIPGTVYGKHTESISVTISEKELTILLKNNRYGVIEMELSGKGKVPVVVSDIQKHKVNGKVLHIDFHQVNMKEPVNTTVSLDFDGKAQGVREGGVLQLRRHDLDIRSLPNRIPAHIHVNIESLGLGENLTAAQIVLPEGVELRTDEHEVVATILLPQKDAEKAEDSEAGEGNSKGAEGEA